MCHLKNELIRAFTWLASRPSVALMSRRVRCPYWQSQTSVFVLPTSQCSPQTIPGAVHPRDGPPFLPIGPRDVSPVLWSPPPPAASGSVLSLICHLSSILNFSPVLTPFRQHLLGYLKSVSHKRTIYWATNKTPRKQDVARHPLRWFF